MSRAPSWFGNVTLVVCGCAALSAFPARAVGAWRPITPEELSLKAPKVEADAGAEAIFYEIELDDRPTLQHGSVRRHYLRIKIFNEAGQQSQGKVELRFRAGSRIEGIEGRTIKPDGTTIELANADIHERTITSGRDRLTRAKWFALPGVEPGTIIEYRWEHAFERKQTYDQVIPLQRDIPIQHLRLAVRPIRTRSTLLHMRLQPFGVALSPVVEEARAGGNFTVTTVTNLPATRKEPDRPPDNDVYAWVLLSYTNDENQPAAEYWRNYAQRLADWHGPQLKPSGTLRSALPGIVDAGASPLDKLTRICEFCRSQIKHVQDDAADLTADELHALKQNKSPSDTLEHRYGSDREITELFGALAATAGLEPRMAVVADRSQTFFKPQFLSRQFIRNLAVAVPVEGRWLLYNPNESYVPCGRLRWQNEASAALIADGKDGVFVNTDLTPADQSQIARKATLSLASDGTLEGDVSITFNGHAGEERKEEYDAETTQRREEVLRGGITKRLSLAELSSVEFQNVTDTAAPLTIRYHVRVPGYAQRTGKRLFVQPSFFEYGHLPRFTASERRYDIYFKYPWSEVDTLDIELPDGYEIERAEGPNPVKAGNVLDCDLTMSVKAGPPQVLHVERRFQVAAIMVAQGQYPALKQAFEAVNALDTHVLALRQTGGAP